MIFIPEQKFIVPTRFTFHEASAIVVAAFISSLLFHFCCFYLASLFQYRNFSYSLDRAVRLHAGERMRRLISDFYRLGERFLK